jgi:ABC-type lipoprotein export system ATPase subunit
LLVTHDPKAAARAQRIVHLEKGQLIEGEVPDAAAAAAIRAGGSSGAIDTAVKEMR